MNLKEYKIEVYFLYREEKKEACIFIYKDETKPVYLLDTIHNIFADFFIYKNIHKPTTLLNSLFYIKNFNEASSEFQLDVLLTTFNSLKSFNQPNKVYTLNLNTLKNLIIIYEELLNKYIFEEEC